MLDVRQQTLLVLRARCGDRDALEVLLRAHQDALFRYISRLTGYSPAEDVLQDVLVQICRKLKWLRDPELFRAWAFRVASRAAFAYLKRERQWRERHEEGLDVDGLAAAEPEPLPVLFHPVPELLEEVSPGSRAVLMLHYVDDLSLEETAAVLEISVGTAKSRLAYGLACLREKMGRKA